MLEYTLVFVFNPDLTRTLLIRKTHPKWQAGKLNGLGGHVMKTDYHPVGAVADGDCGLSTKEARKVAAERELWEETSLESKIDYKDVFLFLEYKGPDYEMSCYWAIVSDENMDQAKVHISAEDAEQLEIWNIRGGGTGVVNSQHMVRGGYEFLRLAYHHVLETRRYEESKEDTA
jgi:8-oxo-dGTP pyrophosphatase MutT (NUDIX family)